MSSQRWSTFTLLNLVLSVALFAFLAGRRSASGYSTVQESVPRQAEKEVPEIVNNKPGKIVSIKVQPKTESLEDRWSDLSTQPGTPSGENEMAALIEKMAESDPQRAISLAAAQTNLRLRASLLRAALKGWGATDPEAASRWTQTETVMDQAQAIDALLQGAVRNPNDAIDVTSALIQNNPGRASEFGTDLISALNESGQFELAASFAVNGPANCCNDWILPAYSRWAEFQPQAAIASAMQIADPGLRDTALNAIVTGWSPTDPKGMVEFAENNFTAEQQNSAISSALVFWADTDPVAAATWINQKNMGSQADNGIAEIALSPKLSQVPEMAANWAESISSSQLRMDTLTSVFKTWMASDPSSAENYLENSSVLSSDDRTQLLSLSKN
jgi:hypothetical protein